MDFLIIILALMLLRYSSNIKEIQTDSWFFTFSAKLTQSFQKPSSTFFLTLFLPIVLVVVLDHFLADKAYGVVGFLLSLVVLLYAMGRGDLAGEIETYKADLERNDLQAAFHAAAAFNESHQEGNASSALELKVESIAAVAYRYLEHYFAVIFWFMLAGPAGALLYRLLQLHAQNQSSEFYRVAAHRFLWFLEWLPVRLTGFTFLLVGSFIGGSKPFLDSLLEIDDNSHEMLQSYIFGALDVKTQVTADTANQADAIIEDSLPAIGAVEALLNRSLVCMICLIAVWVIFG